MALDRAARPKLAPKAKLRWDRKGERHVILYPERGLVLNDMAARIVGMCDGERSVDDIVLVLSKEHGAPEARVRADVLGYLEALSERGLLV